jgi:hypothetical protein
MHARPGIFGAVFVRAHLSSSRELSTDTSSGESMTWRWDEFGLDRMGYNNDDMVRVPACGTFDITLPQRPRRTPCRLANNSP